MHSRAVSTSSEHEQCTHEQWALTAHLQLTYSALAAHLQRTCSALAAHQQGRGGGGGGWQKHLRCSSDGEDGCACVCVPLCVDTGVPPPPGSVCGLTIEPSQVKWSGAGAITTANTYWVGVVLQRVGGLGSKLCVLLGNQL